MLVSRVSAAVAVAIALSGCAAVTTADGERLALTSPEFRTYVERVFREQNRLADEIAFAVEDGKAGTAIAAAEDALLEACAGVNELATSRRDEQRLGIKRSAAAARSVPQCEAASRAAVAALAAKAGPQQ
jgi:hypothetical protein